MGKLVPYTKYRYRVFTIHFQLLVVV